MTISAARGAEPDRTPHRVPQAERSETSRRLMVEATMSILANEGLRAATMVRIQEVAGVSRGLVGYQFGSKQRLLDAVIEHIKEDFLMRRAKGAADDGSGLDQVTSFLDEYLKHLRVDPRPAQVMMVLATSSLTPESDLNATIRRAFHDRRAMLAESIVTGLKDGSVRAGVNPFQHAGVLNGMLRGIVLQFLIDREGFDLEGARVAALDSVCHALSSNY